MSTGNVYENLHISQADRPDEGKLNVNRNETPKPLVTFFKGEPEALGAAQIFVGAFLFTFGLALTIEYNYRSGFISLVYTGVTYWSGIMYIVSGSLSVAASVKPTMGKVKSSLVLNIISSVGAAAGIIILSLALVLSPRYYMSRNYCAYHRPSIDLNQSVTCDGEFHVLVASDGLLSIILLLTVLVFCICISTSAFGCRTVCRTSYSEVNIILYQTNVVNASNTATEAASVSITPLSSTQHAAIQG